jgi:hypothetical protein
MPPLSTGNPYPLTAAGAWYNSHHLRVEIAVEVVIWRHNTKKARLKTEAGFFITGLQVVTPVSLPQVPVQVVLVLEPLKVVSRVGFRQGGNEVMQVAVRGADAER